MVIYGRPDLVATNDEKPPPEPDLVATYDGSPDLAAAEANQ
jgi:hypothetical protein